MDLRIALAGNPNCGKTTLFNALTGSNQFVGNWPGVTVEKKEGKLKKHSGVVITDLPGIYSLSPYTLEEVVARNYLIGERPDAILNIVDGTNLERNLYLTTQLVELGIPVVVAINMMDVVKKNGDTIRTEQLAKELGCKVVEISALKGTGITEAAEAAIASAESKKIAPIHPFTGSVEHCLAHIEEAVVHDMPEEQQRWYAIKLFERDEKVLAQLDLSDEIKNHIEHDIAEVENELDDDAESIITNERYIYISSIIHDCYKKKHKDKMTTSDKIDRVVTNRWAALPIFAVIMFAVYYIAISTVGAWGTDWVNDNLFGDGFHLFGIGSSQYEELNEEYSGADEIVNGYISYAEEKGYDTEAVSTALDTEADDFDSAKAKSALTAFATDIENYKGIDFSSATYSVEDEETLATEDVTATLAEFKDAVATVEKYNCEAPDPAEYGVWVPGIPELVSNGLDSIGCADWLSGLINDGIVAGVGAVLGLSLIHI